MLKNNNQIELVKFISNLKNKIINEKYEISRKEAIFLSKISNKIFVMGIFSNTKTNIFPNIFGKIEVSE